MLERRNKVANRSKINAKIFGDMINFAYLCIVIIQMFNFKIQRDETDNFSLPELAQRRAICRPNGRVNPVVRRVREFHHAYAYQGWRSALRLRFRWPLHQVGDRG